MSQVQTQLHYTDPKKLVHNLHTFFRTTTDHDLFISAYTWWYVPRTEVTVDHVNKQAEDALASYRATGTLPDFFSRVLPLEERVNQLEHIEYPTERALARMILQSLRGHQDVDNLALFDRELWSQIHFKYFGEYPIDAELERYDAAAQNRWDRLLNIGLPIMKRFLEKLKNIKLVVL